MQRNPARAPRLPASSRATVGLVWLGIALLTVAMGLSSSVSWWATGCALLVVPVILVLLSRPEYALYAFVFTIIPSPLLGVTFGEISLRSVYFVVVFLGSSWILARLLNTREPYPGTRCDAALLLFGSWAFISLLWSQDRMTGYEDALKLLLDIATVFLLVAVVRKRRILETALVIFIVLGVVDAVLTLSYPYTTYRIENHWEPLRHVEVVTRFWIKNIRVPQGRGMGFFTAHGTAVTLSMAVTFAFMLFCVTENRKKRVLLSSLGVLMFAALICTLTKSLIASSVIGVIYVTLHLKPLKRRFFTVAFLLIALVGVSFLVTRIQDLGRATTVIDESLGVYADDPGRVTSTESRVVLFSIGIEKLIETRGVGTGIGGFLQYTRKQLMDGSHPAVLFDLGFVGFALWIWILGGAYGLLVETMRKCRSEYFRRMLVIYLGGYVSILISWVVTFSYADLYVWFYLGVGLALVQMANTASAQADGVLPFLDGEGRSIVV